LILWFLNLRHLGTLFGVCFLTSAQQIFLLKPVAQVCEVVNIQTAWMHGNAQRDPQFPPDVKIQVRRNVSQHAFYGNRTVPPKHEK
jgi:hypothetical protein